MTKKVRPNISIDENVWIYWKSRPDVNISGMINSFLKDQMVEEIYDGK